MRSKATFRPTEFLIAAAILVAGLVWAERTAWRQLSLLRAEMDVQQIERFRSADQLRAGILQIQNLWRRGLEQTNGDARTRIVLISGRIKTLLTSLADQNDAPREVALLHDIDVTFEEYLGRIHQSFAAAGGIAETPAPELESGIEPHLKQLLALTEELTQANRSATKQFLADTHAALTRLQHFLFASLVGLLLCGAAIVVLIYRRTIAPLRNTLTESRAIIDRQEKLASLGVFATGIAHEIRNPLTAIKVRLFTLKSSHRPGTSEAEDLEVIRAEIDRLENIVRDFLQFARPAEPEFQVLSASQYLREIQNLLQSDLARSAVELKLDLRAEVRIRVDPNKLKQVLINFIRNGAESMAAGGVVTLRLRQDEQLLHGRRVHAVVIDIVDQGHGIPPEVQKRLFDPFFTTKEAGTGLGLSISARIVEKHGGVIQYQTQPGHGTTFSIVLPPVSENEIQS